MTNHLESYRLTKHKQAEYQQALSYHTKNVALQTVVSFLWIVGALYAKQKDPALIPFVILPSATVSLRKLGNSQTKRQYYKKMLQNLDKEL